MEKSKIFPSIRLSKSTKDLTTPIKQYPEGEEHYELVETCGRGITATVWQARCKPYDEIVAVKILDMESLNCKIEEVIHEAQAMCLYHHPNVLPLYAAFVVGKHLWFVEPFVHGGSVFNIMKFRHPDGLDENSIAIILKEVAKALEYVHRCGGIHRDVKAGNILLNNDGSVLLADFGVAATVERGGSWGSTKVNRNTFVGTPCWMAPEVMEQTSGYDSKADIWSFGITMLELAHGHAPFSKYPPIKVLLMTIQNPPPQLEAECGKRHFSKHMRDLVAHCLQKDPSKRPTASQILESKFFKNIPDTKYLKSHLLDNLPKLTEREKWLQENITGSLEEEKSDSIKTKEEYIRGMSTWDFGDILTSKDNDSESSKPSTILECKPDASTKLKNEDPTEILQTGQAMEKSQDISGSSKMEYASSSAQEFVLSPTKKATDPHPDHSTTETSKASSSHEKNGKPSRFLVTTTKTSGSRKNTATTNPPSETNMFPDSTTNTLYRSHSRGEDSTSSSAVDLTEHEREHHKSVYSKGRFKVHEEYVKKEDVKTEKTKATTMSTSLQHQSGNLMISATPALHDHLQNLLEGHKQMSHSIEQIVEAFKESEKTNPSVQPALAAKVGKIQDIQDSLLHRVKDLENENKCLKERLSELEKRISSTTVGNGPTVEDS